MNTSIKPLSSDYSKTYMDLFNNFDAPFTSLNFPKVISLKSTLSEIDKNDGYAFIIERDKYSTIFTIKHTEKDKRADLEILSDLSDSTEFLEVMKEIVSFVFNYFNLRKLSINVLSQKEDMIGILNNLGFIVEAVFRKKVAFNLKRHDVSLLSLIQE